MTRAKCSIFLIKNDVYIYHDIRLVIALYSFNIVMNGGSHSIKFCFLIFQGETGCKKANIVKFTFIVHITKVILDSLFRNYSYNCKCTYISHSSEEVIKKVFSFINLKYLKFNYYLLFLGWRDYNLFRHNMLRLHCFTVYNM